MKLLPMNPAPPVTKIFWFAIVSILYIISTESIKCYFCRIAFINSGRCIKSVAKSTSI